MFLASSHQDAFPTYKTPPSDEYAMFMSAGQSIFCPYVYADVCIYNVMQPFGLFVKLALV